MKRPGPPDFPVSGWASVCHMGLSCREALVCDHLTAERRPKAKNEKYEGALHAHDYTLAGRYNLHNKIAQETI